MKNLKTTLLMILLVWVIGCEKPRHDKGPKMALDTEASGKNVTVMRGKEAVRPEETVTDLKEQTNIMEHDLGAKERSPSKEVEYVKPGEGARPAEKKQAVEKKD